MTAIRSKNIACGVSAVSAPAAAWTPVSAITWLLAAVGFTAPIGTTALGLTAISEIRHSRGKLVGLPLALADVALTLINRAIGNSSASLSPLELLLLGLVGLIIALPLDYWIVRKAWRAASKPVSAESRALPK